MRDRTLLRAQRTSADGPLRLAATTGTLGGLALFADLALHAFGPLDRGYYVLATVMAVAMLGVPASIWLAGAVGTGWTRVVAAVGTGVVCLGTACWVAAFALLLADPDEAFSQKLTPGGSALLALGMLLLGVGLLASRRSSGLLAAAPLVVGLYFPAQLVAQIAFFLDGKDADAGPNGALLGTWGLLWAATAWLALTTDDPRRAPISSSTSPRYSAVLEASSTVGRIGLTESD